MEYIKLFQKLQEKEVKYLICGGLAVNIYGIPRMTADIDLLLDFNERNIHSFEDVIESFNYRPILPINLNSIISSEERNRLKEEKNLIAFSYYNSFQNQMSVDVLLHCPLSFEEMWEQKEVRLVDEVSINLTSVDHLIEMKKFSDRTQDRQDIIFLTKYKK